MTNPIPIRESVAEQPAFKTDRYTSPAFFEREKKLLFRKTWIVAGRESDIPNSGDRLPFDELDEALFLVRGNDGVVRTFHNTCRHRGTRLVSRRCSAPDNSCP